MPVVVPVEVQAIINAVEPKSERLEELRHAGALMQALNGRQVVGDEFKGAFAEIDSWRFQRDQGRTWDMYWADLTSATRGEQVFHSPDVSSVDDEVIAHWLTRSETTPHPVVQARFADLAWEIAGFTRSAVKPTQDLARRAIDGYLLSVERELYAFESIAWEWLDRALDIAAVIRDETRFSKARDAVFHFLNSVASKHDVLSVIRFEEILRTRKYKPLSPTQRTQVIDILKLELALRADDSNPKTFDPHSARDAADALSRWLSPQNDKAEIENAIVVAGGAFERIAARASPLLAISWLEGQHQRYRDAGMADAVARVEAAIRVRAADAEKEMKRYSVPIEIPKAEYDERIEQIAGDSVAQALRQIAAAGMLRESSIQEDVRAIFSSSVLVGAIPTMIMGPDGFSTASLGSVKEDIDGHAMLHATRVLGSLYASVLNAAFARIREKHGLTVDDVLAHVHKCPFFVEDRMPLLKSGLEHWLGDDHVAAIHILVPQVEAAVRESLKQIGGSVYQFRRETRAFMVKTMGVVLTDQHFVSKVPADVRFHLRALYADHRGINVRNDLSHGQMNSSAFQRGLSNLVVHSILLISMLSLRDNSVPDSEPADPPGT